MFQYQVLTQLTSYLQYSVIQLFSKNLEGKIGKKVVIYIINYIYKFSLPYFALHLKLLNN